MAGKITADQIEHSTAGSLDTQYVVNGSAKAWINLNGTGVIATRDSLNISGIVDGGVGLIDISISAAMGNDDYAALSGGSFDDTASSSISSCFSCRSLTTSSLRVTTAGTVNNVLDLITVTMTIQGDLA